jgi:hypothetical protein
MTADDDDPPPIELLLRQLGHRTHHPCPVRPCAATVPRRLLMCAPHWRLVPHQLQRAVWDAWNQGLGEGSQELLHAQAAAIAAVRERTEDA